MTTLFGFSGTAIVWGLCEVIKLVGLPKRYIPLLAVVLGVALTTLVSPTIEAIITGIVVGLSATGLHELGDRTVAGNVS